ncbi:nuclear transport factor 2 family protein [Bradyrhizobium sp. Pha-3]|uniref:nuclear transport factor 2 family protein n=1 Tax=Bradyrhizobium sp. Pha-3 TaxID=208375 RepID=UPI0035D510BF
MSLFTEDTTFLVYMDSRHPEPTQAIRGREGLRPVFENLSTYQATTHFNGQSTIVLKGDSATGVSYCLAHHVKAEGERRSLMIASIRYLDDFVKRDQRWYFQQRKLMVDWIDHRPLGEG